MSKLLKLALPPFDFRGMVSLVNRLILADLKLLVLFQMLENLQSQQKLKARDECLVQCPMSLLATQKLKLIGIVAERQKSTVRN
jgi:hypothetical protein